MSRFIRISTDSEGALDRFFHQNKINRWEIFQGTVFIEYEELK